MLSAQNLGKHTANLFNFKNVFLVIKDSQQEISSMN